MAEQLDDITTKLTDLTVEEVSIVDIPAVQDAKFIIMKKKVSKMAGEKVEEVQGEVVEEKSGEEVKDVKDIIAEASDMLTKALEEATDDDKALLTPMIDALKGETEDVDKAGRKISKDTEIAIGKIADTLKSVIGALNKLTAKGDYEEEDNKPKRKFAEAKDDNQKIQEYLSDIMVAVKNGHLSDEDIKEVTALF